MMDILEKIHIHSETKLENQINDKNSVKQNVLFDKIIQENSGGGSIPENIIARMTLAWVSHKQAHSPTTGDSKKVSKTTAKIQ